MWRTIALCFVFLGLLDLSPAVKPEIYWEDGDWTSYKNQRRWKDGKQTVTTTAPDTDGGDGGTQPAEAAVPQDCAKPNQAPIDIPLSGLSLESSIPAIKFNYYDRSNQDLHVILEYDNKKVQTVRLWSEDSIQPQVTGGVLYGGPFTFEQAIFHWGSLGNLGSEHKVYGTQYSMEVQFVHYGSFDDKVADALKTDHPILIVSAFLQELSSSYVNQNLEPLVKAVTKLRPDGKEVQVAGLKLGNLLPGRPAYYFRYEGRLNLPNCNDRVQWLVLRTPINIGTQQMNAFRQLRGDDQKQIGDNYRAVQDTDGRRIYTGWTAA